jgi:N-acetylneuraminate synthase
MPINTQLVLLQCTASYPIEKYEEMDLRVIQTYIEKFPQAVTGLSDHTLDNNTAIASIAMGASIIEKHFTLDRKSGGPDDSFSLEPPELRALCQGVKTAWLALGKVDYGSKSSEQGNLKFRRSLYFVCDLKAGEIIENKHVRSVRPGYGLAPKYLYQILGKRVACDVDRNTAVEWRHVIHKE